MISILGTPPATGAGPATAGRGGTVPTPAAGDNTKFLRGDMTFQAIAGGGDLLAANYLGEFNTAGKKLSARTNLDVMSWGQAAGHATQASGGLYFDGATTAGQRVYGALSPQVIGTNDFSVWLRIRMPAAGIAVAASTLCFIGSSTSSSTIARGFKVAYGTGADVTITLYGAVTTDYITLTCTSLRSTYADEVVDLVIVRDAVNGTLTVYANGTAWSAVSTATGGTSPTWSGSITGTYFVLGNSSTTGQVMGAYKCAVFNLALTSTDIDEIIKVGVPFKYKWGTTTDVINPTTPTLNGGFETPGTPFANWSTYSPGTCTVTSEAVIVHSGAAAARILLDATNPAGVYQNVVGFGKAYRYELWAKASVDGKLAVVSDGTYTKATLTLTTNYALYSGVFTVTPNSSAKFYLGGQAAQDGIIFYIDDVKLTRIGAILDWDLTIGKGYWVPDRSTNLLWADMTLGGVTHKYQRQAGEFCIQRYFAHGDISVVALSTALMTLPPNCCILDVEFDRESAFDAGIVLDIGHATDVNHYVDGAAVVATGKLLVDSLDKASKVATGNTTIYIQKSGATTQGATTVRVRCGIRG